MKKQIALGLAAIFLATVGASAQQAGSASGSSSDNDVRVNVQSYGSNIPSRSRVTTTGSAIAPGLAAGAIVCAQSTSVAGGFMGGAFSFGSTRKDEDCNARAWIGTMGAMAGATRDGRYITAASYIACGIDMPGKAMRQAGFACPGDEPRRVATGSRRVSSDAAARFEREDERQVRATNLQIVSKSGYATGKKGKATIASDLGAREFNHATRTWMHRDARGRWVN